MKDIVCTVICLTYNHVLYIKQALDSILEQNTNYGFVIHVFDDASTDGTSDIVREYAKKYPDKIIPFIAEYNQGVQTNAWNAYKSVKTKYVAFLEGDDYWCDKEKLELQIKALEAHPECSFCSTNNIQLIVKEVNETLTYKNGRKDIKEGTYTKSIIDFSDVEKIRCAYTTHLSTRLIRMDCVDMNNIKHKEAFLFDVAQFYYLFSKGKMYWIDKVCSVYRKVGGVWSGASPERRLTNISRALLDVNEETNFIFHQKICSQLVLIISYWASLAANANNKIVKQSIKHIEKPVSANKKNRKLKKISIKKMRHYFLPPFLIDLSHIPRDAIRYLKHKFM